MNTPKIKKFLLSIILIAVMILAGCTSTQNVSQTDSHTQESNTQEYNFKTVTNMSALLSNNISGNENGAYQIVTHWNNTGLITYCDYATMSKIVLSSDINNSYTKDSSAYIDSVLGGVIPIATDKNLFIVKNGSQLLADYSDGEDGYAKIIKMDLNGENQKTLKIPANINMDLNSAFLMDANENLYTLTYNIGENVDDISISLTKFDVDNNDIQNVYTFTDYENIKLLKGFDNYIILQNLVKDIGGNLTGESSVLKFDTENREISSLLNLNMKDNSFVLGDEFIYFSDKAKGEIYSVSLLNSDQQKIFNNENLSDLNLVNFYDSRLIASYKSENNDLSYISIDKNGNISPLEHFYNYKEEKMFMDILGQTQDYFIVPAENKTVNYTIKNTSGDLMDINMTVANYALITKQDYWNNVKNYKYFDDKVEYDKVPQK